MRALNPGEVSRMKDNQDSAMGDRFLVGTLAQTADARGGLVNGFTDGGPQAGAIGAPNSRAVYAADKTLMEADAILRTSGAVTIGVGDRITIVQRAGAACTTEVFYIAGERRTFTTAALYPLKRAGL